METALDFAINHCIFNNTTITITEDILVVPVCFAKTFSSFGLKGSMLPKHMPKNLMP